MSNNLAAKIDKNLISQVVDVFYTNLLDDYRINRYFYSRPIAEQTAPLKELLYALLGYEPAGPEKLSDLADRYFAAAFARGNAKPSLVNNRDFAFLGTLMNGNIVGDDETPRLTLLCPAHSHFLRLQPIEESYDVVLEILASALRQLNVPQETADELLSFAASGRDGVLGRGQTIYDHDDVSTAFRTHG